jgi:hypothetical protein
VVDLGEGKTRRYFAFAIDVVVVTSSTMAAGLKRLLYEKNSGAWVR